MFYFFIKLRLIDHSLFKTEKIMIEEKLVVSVVNFLKNDQNWAFLVETEEKEKGKDTFKYI